MKRYKRLAICAMAVLAMTLAMGSCKKETQNNMTGNAVKPAVAFNPSHITDMDAYLQDFKKKMRQSANAKDGATLSLEEAAWHLSSVANYDFGNINVEYTNVLMDTLYSTVPVTHGEVLLSDLATSYEAIATAIDTYYQELPLSNRHFRYISASISDDGTVAMGLVLTYDDGAKYHNWYPSDTVYYHQFFDENTVYYATSNGMAAIENMLNSIDSHPLGIGPETGRVYLVKDRDVVPSPYDYIDPYCSPNFLNSRIWCTNGHCSEILSFEEMCYYASSYHEIGKSLAHYFSCATIERVASWKIEKDVLEHREANYQNTFYHKLKITIGIMVASHAPSPSYY